MKKRGNSYFELAVNILPKSKHSNSAFEQDIKIKLLPYSKASQITVFIILAIAIIALLILYFSTQINFIEETNPEIKGIYNFIDNCIAKTGEDAIYHIGQTGGYFLSPAKSTESGIAYYFDKNTALVPLKESIEQDLSIYMNELLFFCTKNFVDFPDFNIKQEQIQTRTKITKDKVVFNINYPLTISKDNKKYFLKNFNKEIPSRLDTIYNVAYEITKEQMLYFSGICVNCISDISFENKVFVSILNDPFDQSTIIFSIIDDQYKIKDQDYRFYFANKYDLENFNEGHLD